MLYIIGTLAALALVFGALYLFVPDFRRAVRTGVQAAFDMNALNIANGFPAAPPSVGGSVVRGGHGHLVGDPQNPTGFAFYRVDPARNTDGNLVMPAGQQGFGPPPPLSQTIAQLQAQLNALQAQQAALVAPAAAAAPAPAPAAPDAGAAPVPDDAAAPAAAPATAPDAAV